MRIDELPQGETAPDDCIYIVRRGEVAAILTLDPGDALVRDEEEPLGHSVITR